MADNSETAPPQRSRARFFGIAILLIIVASVIGLLIYQTISPGRAALLVESDPQSIIYINGEQRGKTPLEIEAKAEELVVKIVPDRNTVPLSPYETKVKLAEGVKTIVRRRFGQGSGEDSGQIISFEKVSAGETSVSVVSNPDGVEVLFDGEVKGVSPLKITTSPGEHSLTLSSANYDSSTFEIRAVGGYTTTAIVDLARLPESDNSSDASMSADEKEPEEQISDANVDKIKISETSVGFLRVRAEASTQSEEVGRVEPGDEFEVLEHEEDDDWYLIEYEKGKEGWVSGEFASPVEEKSQTEDE